MTPTETITKIEELQKEFKYLLMFVTYTNNGPEIDAAKAKMDEAVEAAKNAYHAATSKPTSTYYTTDPEGN